MGIATTGFGARERKAVHGEHGNFSCTKLVQPTAERLNERYALLQTGHIPCRSSVKPHCVVTEHASEPTIWWSSPACEHRLGRDRHIRQARVERQMRRDVNQPPPRLQCEFASAPTSSQKRAEASIAARMQGLVCKVPGHRARVKS